MTIIEFINKDMNTQQIANMKFYDKKFFILFYDMEFIKNDDNQIERISSFYNIAFDESYFQKDFIYSYKIKTNIFKNYIFLLDSISKNKINKNYNFCGAIKTAIKENKKTIIEYQKNHEIEYIQRDLLKFIEYIKERENELVINAEKYRNKDLKKYQNLLNALNNLSEREKNTFTYKLIDSNEFELKENKKFFLKWTLKNDESVIKRAIIYILNNDSQKGINYFINDYDFIEKQNAKKWQTKFYYRDLYLKLFNDYLIKTNGDKERAKELTVKDIADNHTRPKEKFDEIEFIKMMINH